MALAREISDPTSIPSQRSAHWAEEVRRGSTTKSFAPRRSAFSTWWKKMGCVSRAFEPHSRITSVSDLAVRACSAACSENRRQTGDARGVSSPVAAVDVVAADDGTDKFLRGIVQLIGGLRAAEHAERSRPSRGDFPLNAPRNGVESFVPACRDVLSVLAYEGGCQPRFAPGFHQHTCLAIPNNSEC